MLTLQNGVGKTIRRVKKCNKLRLVGTKVVTCPVTEIFTIDNCTLCPPKYFMGYAKSKQPIKSVVASSNNYLFVYPSITTNIANVNYQFASNKKQINDAVNRQIILYSGITGERQAAYKVQEKGSLQIAVSNLLKGLYLVQLVENGITVQTEKLMVIR